jgi:hypothetical protein
MTFACKHGNAACNLLEAVAGQAGEEAAMEFLDALWSTNPDREEVVTAIGRMLALIDETPAVPTTVHKSKMLEVDEVATGLRWLEARLQELRRGLT